jgi:hypothetical protein
VLATQPSAISSSLWRKFTFSRCIFLILLWVFSFCLSIGIFFFTLIFSCIGFSHNTTYLQLCYTLFLHLLMLLAFLFSSCSLFLTCSPNRISACQLSGPYMQGLCQGCRRGPSRGEVQATCFFCYVHVCATLRFFL